MFYALIYKPPLTAIYSPVIKLAASLAKNRIAFATSSAVPFLPNGVCSATSFLRRAVLNCSWKRDGVFVFVGMEPNTGFLKGFVELTEKEFIKCDCAYLRTNVPGVFVAGDCRVGAAMQLATAVGDGVVAAMMLKQYFRDPNWWNEPVTDILLPGGR